MVLIMSALTLLFSGRLRSGIESNIECMALLVENRTLLEWCHRRSHRCSCCVTVPVVASLFNRSLLQKRPII